MNVHLTDIGNIEGMNKACIDHRGPEPHMRTTAAVVAVPDGGVESARIANP